MKTFSATTFTITGAAFYTFVSAQMQPILIKGSHFFYENGTEFFIKGIAYQKDVGAGGSISSSTGEPTDYQDPLANKDGCDRDIPLLKELGVNTIRVYSIDPTKDHDYCMKILADAGIYTINDLSNPKQSINRNDPSWTTDLATIYYNVIDTMVKYNNTIGFFAGNEVSNVINNTDASAYAKAAIRDSKAYIKAKGYRQLGVGYATNDDAEIRENLKDYFNCGTKETSVDFWGYNIYSWCGNSSFQESGYDKRTKEFEDYSVPVFMSEYACNAVQPRPFTEVGALYSDQMTNVWSGGIMYMYYQEENDYGLVEIKNGQAIKLPDFDTFKEQLAKVEPSNTAFASYQVTNTALAECPATGTAWRASETLPPIANAQVCSCMVKSLSCVPKAGLTSKQIGTLFGEICGLDEKACVGISSNATTGVHGAYSMCSSAEKLAFTMNAYFNNQNKATDACDFDGNAVTQEGVTAGDCRSILEQAGTAGTGVVTIVPTGAVAATGTGASTSSGTGNAASGLSIPALNVGILQLGAYVLVAGMTGVSMILL